VPVQPPELDGFVSKREPPAEHPHIPALQAFRHQIHDLLDRYRSWLADPASAPGDAPEAREPATEFAALARSVGISGAIVDHHA